VHKRLVVLLLFIGAAAAAWLSITFLQQSPLVAAPEGAAQRAEPQGAHTTTLPSREALGDTRGEVFAARSWAGSAAVSVAAPQPAEPAVRPALPYRYAGKLMHAGARVIVLAKGDAVFFAAEGDTLEDGYRVESIADDRITLLYLQLGLRDTIAMDSMLPKTAANSAAAPEAATPQRARLRWDGPKVVQAGRPFNVALKVTSAQPVYSSPLQLTYDARFLKPVEVRAGAYFAAGEFTQRVSLNGSILVGGSGPGGVAADAEFFVITFMPIGPGGTAALNVATGFLKGEAGAAIEYEPPAPFRASIE
jgi:hypothetical protein